MPKPQLNQRIDKLQSNNNDLGRININMNQIAIDEQTILEREEQLKQLEIDMDKILDGLNDYQ